MISIYIALVTNGIQNSITAPKPYVQSPLTSEWTSQEANGKKLPKSCVNIIIDIMWKL